MSGIRAKDTGIEMTVRRFLHGAGFRYRLHARELPGSPDLVLPKYDVAIQVNGCFWHGHDCHLFKLPSTNRPKWKAKIDRNRCRDVETNRALLDQGWRVLTVWECALRTSEPSSEDALQAVCKWILGDERVGEIRSRASPD